jgi:membrane protease YdiL (CAAX protease family)
MRALWTIVILLLGPVAGAIGGRKLSGVPSRRLIYVSNGLNLIVLGAITAAVDITHGRAALGLLVSATDVRRISIWSVAIAVLCIAVVALTLLLRNVLRRSPKSSGLALLSRGAAEKSAFALLCVLIAIVEEYIHRGFALATLRDWLHSGMLAAGLVCLSFALMHGLQDSIAIVVAFVQGAVLMIPVFVVRSLVPYIAGHFAVDLVAGLSLLPVLHRFRLVPKET